MKKLHFLFCSDYFNCLICQQAPDSTKTIQLGELVISASRLQESISKSPVSIEKLSLRAIQQSAAPSFFDALENVKRRPDDHAQPRIQGDQYARLCQHGQMFVCAAR